MNIALDLFDLDKRVAQAARARERDRARVTHAGDESLLEQHRSVSGTKTLEALWAKAPSAIEAPLRDALVAWVTALLVSRMEHAALRVVAGARQRPAVVAPPAPTTLVSWDQSVKELLLASAGGADAWLTALAESGPALANARRETRDRRLEVMVRVTEKLAARPGETWEKLGLPLPPDRTAALAEAVLGATDALSSATWKHAKQRGEVDGTAGAAIVSSLARDATATFPAKIGRRWLEDLFGHHLRGLNLTFTLPSFVAGAATFARALSSFGAALRTAASSADLPFALRTSPRSLDAERFGAVFGSLAADRRFSRAMLGATPERARRDERTVAMSLLVELRVRAACVLARRDESRFDELTSRVYAARFPAGLSGAWPLAKDEDESALVGAAEAISLASELVERFDEDWFKNPRTFEWIRARGAAPLMSFDTGRLVLEEGEGETARVLGAHFERLLG